MDWGSLNGIYLFGFLLLFTAGGFVIGSLLGLVWTQVNKKVFLGDEEGTELQNESYESLEARSHRSPDMAQIKLTSMPTGVHPWEQTKEYAKGA